jgi:hypothetical protein
MKKLRRIKKEKRRNLRKHRRNRYEKTKERPKVEITTLYGIYKGPINLESIRISKLLIVLTFVGLRKLLSMVGRNLRPPF